MSPLFRMVHSPPFSVSNYRPISTTSVLSKVFERLVSVRLGRFMESSGVLPTSQFAYRKGLGTCVALLCVSLTLQSALESEQEARIMQSDFSAAVDRVNHQGILYKLCSVGISDSVLSILTQFLSNRSQHVMVGVNWLTLYRECCRAVFLALLLFLFYTSEFISILEKYANRLC